MDMIEFIAGLAIGAGGMLAKDKFVGGDSSSKSKAIQEELNRLSDENEKLRNRYKDVERQVEDLQAQNEKLRRQFKDKDDDTDDLKDDLLAAQNEVKKLRAQNDDLARKIQEYKAVCDNYEAEIARIKGQA